MVGTVVGGYRTVQHHGVTFSVPFNLDSARMFYTGTYEIFFSYLKSNGLLKVFFSFT